MIAIRLEYMFERRRRNMELKQHDYDTLKPGRWLNDSIITEYLSLVAKRSNNNRPTIRVLSTYLYTRYENNGYHAVSKWTRKENIFDNDIIFIPINKDHHWALAVANVRERTVMVFDSLHTEKQVKIKAFTVRQFIYEEAMFHWPLWASGWTIDKPACSPKQDNFVDCGVYVLMTAEFIGRNVQPTYSAEYVAIYRREIEEDLRRGRLRRGGTTLVIE